MRTKAGILSLCAIVVGIMSMSANSAQGATLSWLILNSSKTTATELKAELVAELDTAITIHAELPGGIPILVTCTNPSLKGVNLETGGKLTEGGKIIFSGCKVFDKSGTEFKCTVKSSGAAAGTVETNELKGQLVLVGTELLTKIEPKSGPTGNFATVRFEGAECPLTEINQLHGTLFVNDCEGFATSHKTKHLIAVEPVNTAMYVGGHSAKQLEVTKILFSIWLKVGGAHAGLDWSGMDV
jgi:hypothetical protein